MEIRIKKTDNPKNNQMRWKQNLKMNQENKQTNKTDNANRKKNERKNIPVFYVNLWQRPPAIITKDVIVFLMIIIYLIANPFRYALLVAETLN